MSDNLKQHAESVAEVCPYCGSDCWVSHLTKPWEHYCLGCDNEWTDATWGAIEAEHSDGLDSPEKVR